MISFIYTKSDISWISLALGNLTRAFLAWLVRFVRTFSLSQISSGPLNTCSVYLWGTHTHTHTHLEAYTHQRSAELLLFTFRACLWFGFAGRAHKTSLGLSMGEEVFNLWIMQCVVSGTHYYKLRPNYLPAFTYIDRWGGGGADGGIRWCSELICAVLRCQ